MEFGNSLRIWVVSLQSAEGNRKVQHEKENYFMTVIDKHILMGLDAKI